ncbi:MAG: NADH-quinone oxidoreductase subunit NuoF [Acidobacteriota bacterium]|jgi:NADH-quinone oxidoreductase subunit F
MAETLKILTKNMGAANSTSLDAYMASGGYETLIDTLHKKSPDQVLEEVKKADLKGRGGAGFPAGIKWSFLPKGKERVKYLVCNADESEPGTFKDRLLMENDPHQILEGIILAGFATQAAGCFIYIRGEMYHVHKTLARAIEQAYAKGFLGENILGSGMDFHIWLARGAGAYICGEETALMESLEGKRGQPRLKPPFPAGYGVYGQPSNINNVETYANVPHIVKNGADWYKTIGSENTPGPRLFGISGHVKRPGVYELPAGIPLRELIYDHAGGILGDRPLKAVIPGGSSVPVLRADQIDVPMDLEGLKAEGSMLGSAGVIVMNDSVCMVRALKNLMEFYSHESCGQCTPCREGTHWLKLIVSRIEAGEGRDGDCDLILDVADNISFKTICPLGDAAAMPATSFVKQFRDEFEAHIREHRCTVPASRQTTAIG